MAHRHLRNRSVRCWCIYLCRYSHGHKLGQPLRYRGARVWAARPGNSSVNLASTCVIFRSNVECVRNAHGFIMYIRVVRVPRWIATWFTAMGLPDRDCSKSRRIGPLAKNSYRQINYGVCGLAIMEILGRCVSLTRSREGCNWSALFFSSFSPAVSVWYDPWRSQRWSIDAIKHLQSQNKPRLSFINEGTHT